MKLSEISSLNLEPGQYVVTATFDGNEQYNAVQAQYVLTVTSTGEKTYTVQPTSSQSSGTIQLKTPTFYYDPEEINIDSSTKTEIKIPTVYNPLGIPYNTKLISGDEYLFFTNNDGQTYISQITESVGEGKVTRPKTGQQVITSTSQKMYHHSNGNYYTSASSTLTINVVHSKQDPMIIFPQYRTNFYNYEKREGVYMFDLQELVNPYDLPVTYSITEFYKHEGRRNTNATIDNGKVYTANIGSDYEYRIEVTFDGDDTYYPVKTEYYVQTSLSPSSQNKKSPNIYFESSRIVVKKNDDNIYTIQDMSNPDNLDLEFTWSYGDATYINGYLYYDTTGTVVITVTSADTSEYYSRKINYCLVIEEETQSGGEEQQKINPNLSFTESSQEVEENSQHRYLIQTVNNPYQVPVLITSSSGIIQNGYLVYDSIGQVTIYATSSATDEYYTGSASYRLNIKEAGGGEEPQKQSPNLSFASSIITVTESDDGYYTLQTLNNPYNVPVTWTCSKGFIQNNQIIYDSTGSITITVTSTETDTYKSQTVNYTLTINSQSQPGKISPNISFSQSYQTVTENDSHVYTIQTLNNPNNVQVNWKYTYNGITTDFDGVSLNVSNLGTYSITATSVENETYNSQSVTYILYITEKQTGNEDPNISFSKSYDIQTIVSGGVYSLLSLSNPNNVEVEWSSSLGTISNDKTQITYSGTENITISVTSKANSQYKSSTVTYVIILKTGTSKVSPELSFTNTYITITQKLSRRYTLQILNNPYNVPVTWTCNVGTVTNQTNTSATLEYDSTGSLVITVTSQETEDFKQEIVRYSLYINSGQDYSTQYFTIESLEDDNEILFMYTGGEDYPINITNYTYSIYTSTNLSTWTLQSFSSNSRYKSLGTLNTGQKLYIKGSNNSYSRAIQGISDGNNSYYFSIQHRFISTKTVDISGNILSLIYRDSFKNYKVLPNNSQSNFMYMFKTDSKGGLKIIDASGLIMPTSLTYNCFDYMFCGCTSLVNAPELPATTLARYCYFGMFYDCTSLTNAPELPATTLTEDCYFYMFYNCSSLNYIKMLATDVSASGCLKLWVKNVASTGTFIKESTTTLPSGIDGIPIGWTVQNV